MSGQTTQQQPSETQDIVVPDENAPPQPIEVDLESGETTEAATTQPAEQEAPKPKPKTTARDRVQTALRERDEARSMQQELARQLDEARAQATGAQQREQDALRSGMENYAARVKSEADAAQQELETALTSGDAPAIAAANRKVAKVAAAEADVEAWRASQPKDPPAQQQQPRQQPAQQQQPQYQNVPSEPTRQFFEDNPWFHPLQLDANGVPVVDRNGNQIQNPAYDEDLHDAAMLIHKKISRQVKGGALPKNYIESEEYFQQIRDEMAQQFPDAFAAEEESPPAAPARRTPPMSAPRQAVAPAARNSLPNTQRPGGMKVTLSGEERQFVDSLVQNGAMRYPRGHTKQGQKMEAKDAYLEYAKQAQTTRQNQQQ